MAQINVSFGTYNVTRNTDNVEGKGVKVSTMDGIPVYIYAKIDWWNTDAIVESLERDKDKLIQIEKEKRGILGSGITAPSQMTYRSYRY